MYRVRYLVAYDIADAKRLQRVHKRVQAYAIGGQKSFYECWLSKAEFAEFEQKLTALIVEEEDRVLIFQIPKDTEPRLFGTAFLQSVQPFMIV